MVAFKKELELKGAGGYTANVEVFTSTNELVDICEGRTLGKGFTKDRFAGRGIDEGFCGVKSIDEAKRYLREGWSERVKDMADVVRGVDKVCPQQKRCKFEDGVEGFMPIIPKAIMGLPDSMRTTAMKKMKSKVVDIYYDFTCPSYVSCESILKAGFALAGAIVKLEKMNYRVRLSVMSSYSTSSRGDMCIVRLKSEFQPLDLKRLMFPMMHVAMFRCIMFGWYERCPTSTYIDGYGRALQHIFNTDTIDDMTKNLFGDTAIYISCNQLIDGGDDYLKSIFKGKD